MGGEAQATVTTAHLSSSHPVSMLSSSGGSLVAWPRFGFGGRTAGSRGGGLFEARVPFDGSGAGFTDTRFPAGLDERRGAGGDFGVGAPVLPRGT